ncbi:hypothetical protein E2I00_014827, partial [Balaenoptera physalus]
SKDGRGPLALNKDGDRGAGPVSVKPPLLRRPEQELTWSWGHRPRSALDRVKAMAPPPPPPLTASTPLLHGDRSPSDSAAYFCIYTYPRGRRGGRRRAARTFRADGAATYEENQITPDLLPRPPRLLLLVNPFGGRGLAWQWCKNHVLPMISEAGLSFNLIQTERHNHARELVQGLSLSEWDGIVTVSGDGLLYEVLNGLLERPDWEEAVKTPVGILPCGSGNALAGAVNQHGGFEPALGIDLLLNCSLLLCRGGSHPLDLLSVTLASGSRCTPLPPGWVTMEGDFVLILAISPSHLGADLVAAPHARFDDGLVHLCWVRGGISRAALLRLFLAMERGCPGREP